MAFLTITKYKQIIEKLLPPGREIPSLVNLLQSFAAEALRVDECSTGLHDEVDPRTTTDFIDEWEALLGLPDDLIASYPTDLPGRRSVALSRFTATGGQSSTYFIALAYAAGFTIRITEPSTYLFHIDLLSMNPGLSTALLERLIKRYKPAHVNVEFSFKDTAFRAGHRAGERLVQY